MLYIVIIFWNLKYYLQKIIIASKIENIVHEEIVVDSIFAPSVQALAWMGPLFKALIPDHPPSVHSYGPESGLWI